MVMQFTTVKISKTTYVIEGMKDLDWGIGARRPGFTRLYTVRVKNTVKYLSQSHGEGAAVGPWHLTGTSRRAHVAVCLPSFN